MSRSIRLVALLVGASMLNLAFVAVAGPAMLSGLVPILSLFPPGVLQQFATGFATTGPLQTGAGLVGVALGRLAAVHPSCAMAAAALATVGGFAWEVAEVGASTILGSGTDFILGRVVGLLCGIVGAALACRLGLRWGKGLDLPAITLARRSREERHS